MRMKTAPFYDKEQQFKNNVPAEQHNDETYLKAKVNRTNARPIGIVAIIICSLVVIGLILLTVLLFGRF